MASFIPLAVAAAAAYFGNKQKAKSQDRSDRSSYDAAKYQADQITQTRERRRQNALSILDGLSKAYGSNPGVSALTESAKKGSLGTPIQSEFPAYRPGQGASFWTSILEGLDSYYKHKPALSTKPKPTPTPTGGYDYQLGMLGRQGYANTPLQYTGGPGSPGGGMSYEDILAAFDAEPSDAGDALGGYVG